MLRESEAHPSSCGRTRAGGSRARNPAVALEVLESQWVEGAHLMHVGKADRLWRRLHQFADLGVGKPVGHWGGRYLWQLEDSADLVVAWRETPEDSPREAEIELLSRVRAESTG